MAKLSVEENIKKLQDTIELTYQELHRLQGSLRVFLEFKKNGLIEIDLPDKTEETVSESSE